MAPPAVGSRLRNISRRIHQRRFERSVGLPGLCKRYIARQGLVIQAGPFKGLNYIRTATGSSLLPKLIGSYEMEVADFIRQAIAAGYTTVIDVGCAEGYYAVGLAAKMPGASVFAFDIDSGARRLCRRLARINGVQERVNVLGACDHHSLARTIQEHSTLLICDCEGYEADLLDPAAVPALGHVDMVVELHEFLRPGSTGAIVNRFEPTHRIQVVATCDREPRDFPAVAGLSPADQALALNELRPEKQQWLVMRAKSNCSALEPN